MSRHASTALVLSEVEGLGTTGSRAEGNRPNLESEFLQCAKIGRARLSKRRYRGLRARSNKRPVGLECPGDDFVRGLHIVRETRVPQRPPEVVAGRFPLAKIVVRCPCSGRKTTPQVRPDTPAPTIAARCFIGIIYVHWAAASYKMAGDGLFESRWTNREGAGR